VINEGLLMGEANRCRLRRSEEGLEGSYPKVDVVRSGDVLAVAVPVPVEDFGKGRVEGRSLGVF
jgi:hypothetical protein